eukprot:Gb_14976 [translate_table: standard]
MSVSLCLFSALNSPVNVNYWGGLLCSTFFTSNDRTWGNTVDGVKELSASLWCFYTISQRFLPYADSGCLDKQATYCPRYSIFPSTTCHQHRVMGSSMPNTVKPEPGSMPHSSKSPFLTTTLSILLPSVPIADCMSGKLEGSE